MVGSINLYNQFLFQTDEVCYEVFYDMLSIELDRKPLAFQDSPEHGFCLSRMVTVFSSPFLQQIIPICTCRLVIPLHTSLPSVTLPIEGEGRGEGLNLLYVKPEAPELNH